MSLTLREHLGTLLQSLNGRGTIVIPAILSRVCDISLRPISRDVMKSNLIGKPISGIACVLYSGVTKPVLLVHYNTCITILSCLGVQTAWLC